MKIKNDYISIRSNTRSGWKLKEVKGIVVHYTASPGDTAKGERSYFSNGAGGRTASAHIFVDENEAICIVPLDEICFHANETSHSKISKLNGSTSEYKNGNANTCTVSIEMCTSAGMTVSKKVIENTISIVNQLCSEFNLTASDVYRHYDITGKNCPKPFVEDESKWKDFLSQVEKTSGGTGLITSEEGSSGASSSVKTESEEELKARREKEHAERNALLAKNKTLRDKKRKEFTKKAKENNWSKERISKSIEYLDKLEFLSEEAIKRADFFQDFSMPGSIKAKAKVKEEAGSEDNSGEISFNGEVDMDDIDFSVIPEGEKRNFIKSIAKGALIGYSQYDLIPSIVFGQGALESGWGKKDINNNLFGIKATGSTNAYWKGAKSLVSTKEDYGAGKVSENAYFRNYDSRDDSVLDHALLLGTNARYKKVPGIRNYKEAIKEIKAAGYATDSAYVSLVADGVIRPNNLNFLDDPKFKKLVSGSSIKTSKSGEGKGKKLVQKAKSLIKEKESMTSSDFLKECVSSASGKDSGSVRSFSRNDTLAKDISMSNLKSGDIIFLSISESLDVAGIYTGNNKAIICKNKKVPEYININSYKNKLYKKGKRLK